MPLSITYNPADSYTYVADAQNNCIRRIDNAGNVTTYAGQGGSPGLQDGSNTQAKFSQPSSIAIANGFMYIADTANNAIRQIDMVHQQVSTLIH
jgi:DNA-binding beta-propeller fold protein YncE